MEKIDRRHSKAETLPTTVHFLPSREPGWHHRSIDPHTQSLTNRHNRHARPAQTVWQSARSVKTAEASSFLCSLESTFTVLIGICVVSFRCRRSLPCPFRNRSSRLHKSAMTKSTESANAPIKRTKALVDSEVQGGVLKKFAVHWLVFFFCNALALTIWVRLFEQPEVGWAESFGDTMKRFLPFFVITMSLIPAFIWDTLKLTNRFAGPMLRFRAALADAREGRAVPHLAFRDNDFWKEVAENFNAVMERQNAAAAKTDRV
jgi:hypothetical protein